MISKELEEYKIKLDSLTQKTAGCWYYTGPITKGRGYIKLSKHREHKQVRSLAYELFNKEKVPEWAIIKTTCEVPACINPNHFELSRKTFPWRI